MDCVVQILQKTRRRERKIVEGRHLLAVILRSARASCQIDWKNKTTGCSITAISIYFHRIEKWNVFLPSLPLEEG
jgi:hypothetical protein